LLETLNVLFDENQPYYGVLELERITKEMQKLKMSIEKINDEILFTHLKGSTRGITLYRRQSGRSFSNDLFDFDYIDSLFLTRKQINTENLDGMELLGLPPQQIETNVVIGLLKKRNSDSCKLEKLKEKLSSLKLEDSCDFIEGQLAGCKEIFEDAMIKLAIVREDVKSYMRELIYSATQENMKCLTSKLRDIWIPWDDPQALLGSLQSAQQKDSTPLSIQEEQLLKLFPKDIYKDLVAPDTAHTACERQYDDTNSSCTEAKAKEFQAIQGTMSNHGIDVRPEKNRLGSLSVI